MERKKRPVIETFTNELAGKRDYSVTLDIASLVANCPLTGANDIANVVIRYTPKERCVETKALRQFISYWKDYNTLSEQIINWILDCFVEDVQPKKAEITAEFEARGNIRISVRSSWQEGEWRATDTREVTTDTGIYGSWRCLNPEWEATFPEGSIWGTKRREGRST